MYRDSLIEIKDETLIIYNYYFPFIDKTIWLKDVSCVYILENTIFNGAWRIYGMGVLPIWYGVDTMRFTRDKLFAVELDEQWVKCGFTAHSSAAVIDELQNKGISVRPYT